ncbi:MAG: ABC transporter ATP-binding protein [Puniceicoccales bacterium]|jgi:ABC-type Fe3+/spermidine/putrescine transport system ATPase subunit|nr:ABC transporter ATP-binding protein [Puniceicoccales bacterium]
MPHAEPPLLALKSVTLKFNDAVVLDGVNLTVRGGEMLFVAGRSGAGKTTLLRVIAGALAPTAGGVLLEGRECAAPAGRVVFVTQENALWPHLNIRENVAFALRQRGLEPEEVRERVGDALAALGLDMLGGRKPSEMCASERRRAALARALAQNPSVLLLDEPFAFLDERARRAAWENVRKICAERKIAAVCVSQITADVLAFADRIALLDAGVLAPPVPPLTLYRRPFSRFAGEFFSDANCVAGKVLFAGAGEFIAKTPLGEVRGTLANAAKTPAVGAPLDILIRPESLHIDAFAPDENAFAGSVLGAGEAPPAAAPAAPAVPPSATGFGGATGLVLFKTRGGITLRVKELNPRVAGGGVSAGQMFAWVAPEDVTGVEVISA